MFSKLELLIGLRYLRAKRRNHFASFISMMSIAGMAVGIMALITVLSVMNGFETKLRERILAMTAHASVIGTQGPMDSTEFLIERIKKFDTKEIQGAASYIEGEAMLRYDDRMSGGILRGLDPAQENQVSDIAKKVQIGSFNSLQAGKFNIIIGLELARNLGLSVGDNIDLLIPQSNMTPAGLIPRFRRFHVTGIFSVGMYEYDRSLMILHIKDAQALYRMGSQVHGIRLKLAHPDKAGFFATKLNQHLGKIFWVSDWTSQHVNFFKALRTERLVMFIILSLIIMVAAFNIVSTLVMVVTDKRGDIAILRTQGIAPNSIMKIFIVQGMMIGLIGTFVGLFLGILLALNLESLIQGIEHLLGIQFMSSETYQISEVPSLLDVWDVVKIGFLAFFLSILSTIYPAWSASRLQPAEVLRYE